MSEPCPHCRGDKEPRLFLCRPCWHEVPWKLRVAIWDAISKKDDPATERAKRAALSHLAQHSTAL